MLRIYYFTYETEETFGTFREIEEGEVCLILRIIT